ILKAELIGLADQRNTAEKKDEKSDTVFFHRSTLLFYTVSAFSLKFIQVFPEDVQTEVLRVLRPLPLLSPLGSLQQMHGPSAQKPQAKRRQEELRIVPRQTDPRYHEND